MRTKRFKLKGNEYVFCRIKDTDPDFWLCSSAVRSYVNIPCNVKVIYIVCSSTKGDFRIRPSYRKWVTKHTAYIEGVKDYIVGDTRVALRELYDKGYRYLSVEYYV